jgi:hypothetical protein
MSRAEIRLAQDQPKIEIGDLVNRCPHCGYWFSSRYSASMPHQCKAVQGRTDLQKPLPWAQPVLSSDPFPPHWRAPAQPAHVSAANPGSPTARAKPTPWAGTARALAGAWWIGCLCGAFAAILAVTLLK